VALLVEDKRKHAGRIVAPILAGSLLVACAGVLFPIIGMPAMTLVGVVVGVGVMLSTGYVQERRFLRRFCDSKTSLLPAARIPPTR
jgi:hypothetical protein